MKVLFVTSELSPWIKTGGLGDAAAALPEALRTAGADVRILMPCYPALKMAFGNHLHRIDVPPLAGEFPASALCRASTESGIPLYLLDCDALYGRAGNPYLGPEGHDWLDNSLRFGLLSRVAAMLSSVSSPLDWMPDVLHCHDWQTGLAPAYLHYNSPAPSNRARSVMTIHNLAFQGLCNKTWLPRLGLPAYAWATEGVEFHGQLSFLKAGIQHADAITTVSTTYAREIQTEVEGMGLDGLLRYRSTRLSGIVNGIDAKHWNPANDVHLPAHYTADDMEGKSANTQSLRHEMGLADDFDGPLLGVISRLTTQKGLDLLPQIAAELAVLPVQLVVLGSGDREIEHAFRALAKQHPGQFVVRIGFDEGLAHRIEAGADLFLMPSRFEPCGLSQLYSLRYGTPPIVRATGGLADTVIDAADLANGTGFVFRDATPDALLTAIHRAVSAWRQRDSFAALQRRGMSIDWSWEHPAQAYLDLYERVCAD